MIRAFGWILPVLVAGTIFAQPPPSPATAPKNSITVAYWNIQWFPGKRPSATRGEENKQIGSVHRDLARLDVDLLGMEEVRDFEQATVAVQQIPGFKVDVCSNFPPREGQNVAQQVAIASRLSPVSAWAEHGSRAAR